MPGSPDLVPLDAILEARARIASRVHRTPMLTSETGARIAAAAGIVVGDGRLYLKAEHLQKTGSFKARGITNKMLSLTEEEHAAGIVTFSAGNAAQAFAWAAREAGVNAVVVMPAGAVRSKVDAALGYGAEVVLHGVDAGEAFAEMERLREARGLVFCHPFDDPAVIAGHGSVGLEIVEDLPQVDVVVVPVGGGGLISGIASAIKERRPSARVYGVEPEGSNALSLGIAAGEPVRIAPRSIADGLNAPFAGAWTIAIGRRYIDDIVVLDDPTILAGLRFGLERLKQVLEPAGAAALAAVLFGRVPIRTGERVVVVLSGGNVDMTRLGVLIAGAAPLPGTTEALSEPAATAVPQPTPVAPASDAGPAPTADVPPTPVPPPITFALPSARSLVAAGFELLRTSQPELRRASLYIGLLTLLVIGPATVFVVYLLTQDPEVFGIFFGFQDPLGVGSPLYGAEVIATLAILVVPGILAVSIEAQNLGLALLAARNVQRPMTVHEALRRSRQAFWRVLAATMLISVAAVGLSLVSAPLIVPFLGEGPDASALASAVFGIAFGMPFAYMTTGIIVGNVGAVETLKRSLRLARARPRLALVIALFATAVSVIQTFALGAGGDALLRVSEFLHLGFESGPILTLLSVVLILAGVVAIGSLTFTISAIAVAPQVVAFLGLTHHDGGLDLARQPVAPVAVVAPVVPPEAPVSAWSTSPSVARTRLVTLPMLALAALAALIAVAGISGIPGS
jgi:threonine dehydratase